LDIIAGTSVRAVNAAIIVGSKINSPAQGLEHFWLALADNIPPSFLSDNIRSLYASMFVATYGNSSVFEPIWFSAYTIYNYPSFTSTSSSYPIPHPYGTIPLKKTLNKFIDFDKINNYSNSRQKNNTKTNCSFY
jgi:NTE family protein